MINQIEFKPSFALVVWFILLYYLNFENLQEQFRAKLCWKWKIFNN
jgi:hypothetical protein